MKFNPRLALSIAGNLLAIVSFAQDCDSKGNKKSNKILAKAQEAQTEKQWAEAKANGHLALKTDSNNIDARYFLAHLYLEMGQEKNALQWFTALEQTCPELEPELDLILAELHGRMNNHKEAVSYYDKVLASNFSELWKEERDYHHAMDELLSNPVPFNPQLVPGVSTDEDEYLAYFTADESEIYFTRRYLKDSKSQITAFTVEEFFMAQRQGESYSKGEVLSSPFNQRLDEGGPSLTATNHEMFLTVCRDAGEGRSNCDIFYTHKKWGYWTELVPLPAPINLPDSWESQPSVSPDGKTLYFVSSRAGGYGGLDIYRVNRLPNGQWGAVENLGPDVNTARDDKAPFIHADSQTLYFASRGHVSVGGFDLFKCQLNTGDVQNLGIPINSPQDELGLMVSLDGKRAFFASNQLQGEGGWDLYSFDLHEAARPQDVFMIKGQLESLDQIPAITLRNLKNNEAFQLEVDSASGDYLMIVDREEGADFLLSMQGENQAFQSQYISADSIETDASFQSQLQSPQLKQGQAYTLNNIQFAHNSYALNPRAQAEIAAFAEYLQNNPKIKIRIEGHTDAVGNSQENLILSEQRAQVVLDALVDLGVAKSRLRAQGFGASKPIASNETDAGRAMNRRTVFVIQDY